MWITEAARALIGTAVGAILYIPFSLIPIVGPMSSGYAQGKIMKAYPGRSFVLGLLSGILGFIIWLYLLTQVFMLEFSSLISWIALWLFFAWNMMQVFFNAVGCSFASMAYGAEKICKTFKVPEKGNNEYDIDLETFVICPACGISNPDGSVVCASCGARLER